MIINTKKSGGITPTGKKLITDTSETDVAAFATAQVSSDTLLAENIKKDVNILGVVGSYEGSEAPEYVTDGLIAMYDAIDNTRSGHNAAYAGWQDVSGSGHDLTHAGGNMPIWGDNFCYLSNCWLDGEAILNATHIEIVTQLGYIALFTVFGTGNVDDAFGDGFSHNNTTYAPSNKNGTYIKHTNLPKLFTAAFEDDKIFTFADIKSSRSTADFAFTPTGRFYLGGRNQNDTYSCHDYICAIRLYNRQLSIGEVVQNYIADAMRFGTGFTLDELFTALPTVTTAHTIKVNAEEKAAASAETIAIATGKGWTVA